MVTAQTSGRSGRIVPPYINNPTFDLHVQNVPTPEPRRGQISIKSNSSLDTARFKKCGERLPLSRHIDMANGFQKTIFNRKNLTAKMNMMPAFVRNPIDVGRNNSPGHIQTQSVLITNMIKMVIGPVGIVPIHF